jgi:hypothetical protein
VARDYELSKTGGNKLDSKSKLVYIHDIIGKMSDIYDTEIRTGEKSVFGIINEYPSGSCVLFSDHLLNKLKDTNEANKYENFNKMIIAKSQMSKVLMKIMNHNYINPLFVHISDELTDQLAVNNAKKSIVKKFIHYLNIDTFNFTIEDVARNNAFDILGLKFIKGVIYHMFFYAIIQKSIIPSGLVNFPNFRSVLNRAYFTGLSPIISTLISNIQNSNREDNTIELLQTNIRIILNKIYESLYNFLNIFFNEDIPSSYNYNIINMYSYKPLLNEINKIINRTQFTDLKDNINNALTDIYTTTPSLIFPDKEENQKEYILNTTNFFSELTDMAMKFNIVESLTLQLGSIVNILNIISEITELPEDNDKDITWYNNIRTRIARGDFYQTLLEDPIILDAIGFNKNTAKEKLNHLFKNLINGLRVCHLPESNINTGYTVMATLCIAAFENYNIYEPEREYPDEPPRAPREEGEEGEGEDEPPVAPPVAPPVEPRDRNDRDNNAHEAHEDIRDELIAAIAALRVEGEAPPELPPDIMDMLRAFGVE